METGAIIRGFYRSLIVSFLSFGFTAALSASVATETSAYNNNPAKHADTVWIAGETSITNLSGYTGEARFVLDNLATIQALGTDAETGNLWVVSAAGLQGYTPDGTPLLSTPASIPVADGVDGRNNKEEAAITALVVDGKQGRLWLVAGNQLHRFSISGIHEGTVDLAFPVTYAVLDREASLLWVAGYQQLAVLNSDGVVQAAQTLPAPVTGLASAARDKQLLVLTSQNLLWYARSGELQKQASNPLQPAAEFVAVDGQGGVWLANNQELAYLNEAGGLAFVMPSIHDSVAGQSSTERQGSYSEGITHLLVNPRDHSAWVASNLHVSQVFPDSSIGHERDVQTGVLPQHLEHLALYADMDAPEVFINHPTADFFTNDSTPDIHLAYQDIGSGVDGESIRLTLDDAPLAANCVPELLMALCTPVTPLADGYLHLLAYVSDYAINESEPAEQWFTVDTIAPAIHLNPMGTLTNQSALTLRGRIEEPHLASLTINNQAVSVNAQHAFTFAATLVEGDNRFKLHARDLAGNESALTQTVTRDTVAPQSLSSLSVQIVSTGEALEINGAAGTVEAGVRVTVRNTRTGATVSVIAAADGSFTATLHGESSDRVEFVVTDTAGNTSDAVEMPALAVSGMALAGVQETELPYDPQTALMTVIEPKLEADTTSASPLGDDYDPVTGSVTFSVTDISIPGNFAIPVELRRWVPSDDYDTGGPTGWAWNIPFIRGNYLDLKDGHVDNGWDWSLHTWHDGYNCSGSAGTVVTDKGELVAGNAYWQGKLLHIPGVTSETFLITSSGEQVTKSNFRVVDCITSNPPDADGIVQQGIVVAGPNGLTYTFNQIKSYHNGKITLKDPIVRTRLLMVTKIEDRFGNHVDYSYANGELSQISASDGRTITINYELVNNKRRPTTATAHGRSWTYTYETSGTYDLSQVTLPDGVSTWRYSNVTAIAFDPNAIIGNYNQRFQVGSGQTTYIPGCSVASTVYTAEVTTPWGLTSTYTFENKIHYRSDVEPELYEDGYSQELFSRTTYCTVKRALTAKSIQGPGIATANWSYEYSTNEGTYSDSSFLNSFLDGPFDLPAPVGGYPAPITTNTAVDYRSTTVTGPERTVVFYIDRKFQSLTENRVVAKDTLNAAGTELLQRTQSVFTLGDPVGSNWYLCPCDGIYPPVNKYQLSYRINQTQSLDKRYLEDGVDTYTTDFSNFDDYGFYLTSQESNSLGYQRTITRTFLHDTTNGLIGLPLTEKINGVTVKENHYDSLGQLEWIKSFGKLQATLGYDTTSSVASGQRGTLKTVKDGNNNTSTLSNWKRGTPQLVQFADGSSRSGTVNDSGWLMSTTDENGYTTSYTYDDMGQLASITRPVGDSTDWAVTTRSVVPATSAEYGIAAGHWRVTTATGNARKITYYDALLRPLLTREYDTADQAGTQRFNRFAYDLGGRVTYATYPSTSSSLSNPGTSTEYDALGRITSVSQDSELGSLTTTHSYLSGARIRITNPRSKATTTTYMAYGQPGTDWPVLIAHPEGAYTHIERDIFGKPTKIRRSDSSNPTGGNLFVDRIYEYNNYQELCRSVEPETGVSLSGYDAAGNLKWSASGLPLTTTNCEPDGTSTAVAARRIDRTYDVRNRLKTLAFPDGKGNQVWTYTPDGLPEQVTTDNAAAGETVVNSYTYNKRRLLEVEAMTQPGQAASVIAYDYDANGALASLTYPSGRSVAYAPNALGQPTTAGIYATGASYYPNGALHQFIYGHEDGHEIVHTMAQNVRQLPASSIDGTVLNLTTTYDANGNVATIVDGTSLARQSRTMAYDALDRLTGTTSPMFGTASYGYDVLDNLVHVGVTGGSDVRNHDYCYANNQLNKIMTGGCGGTEVLALTYDAQGNLSAKGAQAYTFDYGNRLREATGLESYRYDANGRRVYSHTTAGDIYSFYGQDGVLRYMDNRRTGEQTDYIYLAGSLVAEVADATASIAVPTLTVPSTNTTGSYTVSWTSVATATTYELQERQVGGEGWSLIHADSATSKALSGRNNGSYGYRVRACNASGCSLWSATETVTRPPEAPGLIAPSATNSTGGYTVQWTTIATATAYELEEQVGSGSWLPITLTPTSVTSKSFSGKSTGTYSYRVRACNASGCSNGWSATRTVAVMLPPSGAPTLTVPSTNTTGSYTVSWTTVPTATLYELQENVVGNWSLIQADSATSKAFSGKASGVYNYRVRACNAGGCAAWSAISTNTVTRPPAQVPTLEELPSTNLTGSYTVSWTAAETATRYELEERVNSGSWTKIHDSITRSKAFSDRDTATYSYRVRACNEGSCGDYSAVKSVAVTRPPTAPAITSLTLTKPSGKRWDYAVSWTSSAHATRYELWGPQYDSLHDPVKVYDGSSTSYSYEIFSVEEPTEGFRVKACNSAGCSGFSPPKIPLGVPDVTAPSTNTSGSYTVSWTDASAATSYKLDERFNSGSWNEVYSGTLRSKSFSGKSTGTYSYRARACDAEGCGSYSTIKSVVVTRPPTAPAITNLTLTKPSGKRWDYAVSWTSSAHATRYELWGPQYDSLHDPVKVYDGSSTSYSYEIFNIDEPTAGFSVRACNSGGCSGFSALKRPLGVPSLTVPSSNTSGSYTVSWTAATAATSYKLDERVNSGSWS